jgi:succinyl-diaminopimelate desuccinylase
MSHQNSPQTPSASSSDETDSIVAFTAQLVRIPAQGGIDQPKSMLQAISAWLTDHGVNHRLLLASAKSPPSSSSVATAVSAKSSSSSSSVATVPDPVAVVIEIQGALPGPTYCFDACVDTAPAGNLASWTKPPFAAVIEDGWLYGRGSADSKVAVAILCHLALEFQKRRDTMHGKLTILLDGDEHTGRFGGVKEYIAKVEKPDGLVICYPGNDRIAVGARGFYRVSISVPGFAQHAGSSQPVKDSAVTKAVLLAAKLNAIALPKEADEDFYFGPKLTITAINGGSGFAQVPDLCVINVDVRLTPSFTAADARLLIKQAVDEVDGGNASAGKKACTIKEEESWPQYKLAADHPLVASFVAAASDAHGRAVTSFVCGPSNIGCYLSSFDVPATCGFGVNFRGLHAADEAIEIASILPVVDSYRKLVENLLFPEVAPEKVVPEVVALQVGMLEVATVEALGEVVPDVAVGACCGGNSCGNESVDSVADSAADSATDSPAKAGPDSTTRADSDTKE